MASALLGTAAADLFFTYNALRSNESLARSQRRLVGAQTEFQRSQQERAIQGAFRAGIGAQRQALGAGNIVGGRTSQLFELQSQLEESAARAAADFEAFERRAGADIAAAQARDATTQGLAQGLLDFAGQATLFRAIR